MHHKIEKPYLVIYRSLYFGEQAVEHLGRHPKGDKETLRVGIIEFIPDAVYVQGSGAKKES